MKEEQRQEIESWASRILASYFCDSEVEFLISTFAPDIVWLGAGENQKAEGREAVAACFREGQGDLAPCDMSEERYVTTELAPDLYLCQGESWIQPKPGTGMYFRAHQRVTFIFQRENGRFITRHIHNSVSFADLLEHELFPAQAAQEAYKRLEKILIDKERQIELMLSQLPGGMQICRIDDKFSTEWISDNLCSLLGYRDQAEYAACTGNSCRGFICPEDYGDMHRIVSEKLENQETYYVEYRARRKDGTLFWVSDMGKCAPGPEGGLVLYCYIADITERKQREFQIMQANREVQRQARFLTQLYNTVPCGILQFLPDQSHQVVNVNRMVWEFYGFESEAEYRSQVKEPFQLVLDEDRPDILHAVKQLRLDEGTVSYTRKCVRRDGAQRWISVTMERLINTNGLDVIQAVFTDVTDIKTLQEAQEKERLLENRLLRAAICTAYPMIMSVNLTRDTYHCFIEEQASYTAKRQGSYDELIEDSLALVYPSYQKDFKAAFSRENILRRFANGEHEVYMELKQRGVDGQYHWISVHIIYVEHPFSSDVLAIDLVKVLDSQRAEQARQEQLLRDALAAANAANSAKSNFLSRMSHDIRTPMNAIIGMSAIGQLKKNDPDKMQDCFRKIDTSSRYLLSLINDILDMSKIETGKMTISHEKFDLSELLEEIDAVLCPQTAEQEITYEVRYQEPLDTLYYGDVLRLKQILMNLLSNALKFTPSGGHISIHIREEKRTNGFAYLCFAVSDTGIGIAPEFMQKIFQPFEQETAEGARNNVGSGLGLSIVHNLVQLMGGEVRVDSQKGRGSVFTLNVPLELAEDDLDKEQKRKDRELLLGVRVLVADDDPTVGEQVSANLSELGACIKWVDSGRRAVEVYRQSLESRKPYEIAMIDWKMPGMNGLETVREIRAMAGPEVTIIIISAYDWSSIEAEARAVGVDYFIAKPLFRSTLRNTFSRLEIGPRKVQEEKEQFRFSGQRVLLVEDNALNLEIAKSILEMYGLVAETAENGETAVARFSSSPAGYYMAVLMDIRMPVMDGIEAAKRMRGMDHPDARGIPILAMTANAFEEDKQLAMRAGFTGYMVKPLDMHLLLQELTRVSGLLGNDTQNPV